MNKTGPLCFLCACVRIRAVPLILTVDIHFSLPRCPSMSFRELSFLGWAGLGGNGRSGLSLFVAFLWVALPSAVATWTNFRESPILSQETHRCRTLESCRGRGPQAGPFMFMFPSPMLHFLGMLPMLELVGSRPMFELGAQVRSVTHGCYLIKCVSL